ncbi:MAG: nitroreductase family protein [Deltaproteobacteria bacterium]|nr:nitroreductase family protein [Deltaproteobacteria bacterium]
MHARSEAFLERIRARRSVRFFKTDPVPLEVVRRCIEAAGQAPSGANKQPWTFVLVTDPALKTAIREGAEIEEREFYENRANDTWLADLAAIGTDEHKPFLEEAPALIVCFAQKNGPDGGQHYYVQTSIGIACGFLIAALNDAGLATLTHTPSPMKFLGTILGRPRNEKPFLLLPVGYPTDDCTVPDIRRKDRPGYLVENPGVE